LKQTEISVLLVHSPEASRNSLRAALEREAGVSVVGEADSHASAMRLFFERRPDVVVAGVCLQDSSGFDVLVCVRQADARCPLILLGDGQDSFVEYVGRVYGATEVCYKDDNYRQVRGLLRRLVQGKNGAPRSLDPIGAQKP
jgi:DNA-binding NarL/FixJ family response regulator